jgi:hypothetical protein
MLTSMNRTRSQIIIKETDPVRGAMVDQSEEEAVQAQEDEMILVEEIQDQEVLDLEMEEGIVQDALLVLWIIEDRDLVTRSAGI